jgi:hypothetical protein
MKTYLKPFQVSFTHAEATAIAKLAKALKGQSLNQTLITGLNKVANELHRQKRFAKKEKENG